MAHGTAAMQIVVMIANDREQCWVGRFEEEPKTNDAAGLNVKQRNKPVAEEE